MTAPPDRIFVGVSKFGDLHIDSRGAKLEGFANQPEYVNLDGPTMQAAIAAAEARGREQMLRVKPLEWNDCETVYPDGSGRKVAFGYAPLSPGYTIYESPAEGLQVVSGTGFSAFNLPDLDAVKAAAQADHEARIASALIPLSPSPVAASRGGDADNKGTTDDR